MPICSWQVEESLFAVMAALDWTQRVGGGPVRKSPFLFPEGDKWQGVGGVSDLHLLPFTILPATCTVHPQPQTGWSSAKDGQFPPQGVLCWLELSRSESKGGFLAGGSVLSWVLPWENHQGSEDPLSCRAPGLLRLLGSGCWGSFQPVDLGHHRLARGSCHHFQQRETGGPYPG